MESSNKTLFGIMAFGPLVLAIIGFLGIIGAVLSEVRNHPTAEPPFIFWVFLGLILVSSVLSLISLIMYIIHISRNNRLDEGGRIGWIIGMVFAHGIVAIVYFFMYIAKDDPGQQAQGGPKSQWDV